MKKHNNMQWTPEQESAIFAREGTLLVAAAAGSGKTAVLVQRVIERLANENNPCAADSLVVVTFTRAAAAQMRERIACELANRLRLQPKNAHLLRQQQLLPFAQISTIDSFCNTLVKEHFHLSDIEPDFSFVSGPQEDLLMHSAVQQVLDDAYAQNEPAFTELTNLLSSTRDDSTLLAHILKIYESAQSHPNPNVFLEQLLEPYRAETPFAESPWCKRLLQTAEELLQSCIEGHQAQIETMRAIPALADKYMPVFMQDLELFTSQLAAVQEGWERTVQALLPVVSADCKIFAALGRVSDKDVPEKEQIKQYRDAVKEAYKKTLLSLELAPAAEHEDETRRAAVIAEELIRLVKAFSAEYSRRKRENNQVVFSDVLHLALSLLVEKTDAQGNPVQTALAKQLSTAYSEILVDEYQDTNHAQELLFRALSRDGKNIFYVGDVKQSIYRFRLSDPQLFLQKQWEYPLYAPGLSPAKLLLRKNFRSREGITAAVNFFFGQLMQKDWAEITYDEQEQLVAAAQYPPDNAARTHLHLLPRDGADSNSCQAAHIAHTIRQMLQDGSTVYEGGTPRPLRLKDICILMRGKTEMEAYVQLLARQGIPAHAQAQSGLFQAKETKLVLSFLQVLDNPVQDVPLLALLLSPLFGFCADDLARLRLACPQPASLYTAVQQGAQSGDKACAAFLAESARLRNLACSLGAAELLRRLYDESGLLSLVGAMRGGGHRQSNLRLLLEYARQYDAAHAFGLSGFLRYLDAVQRGNSEFEAAADSAEQADVVRIMTIHKSKGLEFPVVFLAGCHKSFHFKEEQKPVLLSQNMGLGLQLRDDDSYTLCKTAGFAAAAMDTRALQLAEELRLFYVALTRAKETLILVSAPLHFHSSLKRAAGRVTQTPFLPALWMRQATCFEDWLLPAALRHPDAHKLRELANIDDRYVLPAGFRLHTVVETAQPLQTTQEEIPALPNAGDAAQVRQWLDYTYPYASLDNIVAKQTASELAAQDLRFDSFFNSCPAFLRPSRLSAAQRGTLTHRFLQHANWQNTLQNAAAECERLIIQGVFSEQESAGIALELVLAFLKSGLAKRAQSAKNVWRERKFTMRLPARELYPDLPPNLTEESVVVQGTADLVFQEGEKLVLVDYKTDHVRSTQELKERYRVQIQIYRRALEECLALPVQEAYLYSLTLGEAINC